MWFGCAGPFNTCTWIAGEALRRPALPAGGASLATAPLAPPAAPWWGAQWMASLVVRRCMRTQTSKFEIIVTNLGCAEFKSTRIQKILRPGLRFAAPMLGLGGPCPIFFWNA